MTTGSAAELHYLLEGPQDAPVVVMANSLGTTLRFSIAQRVLADLDAGTPGLQQGEQG